jgi:hypothetical protein
MTDSCDLFPGVMLFVGCFGLAWFIMRWSRDESDHLPAWHWGDTPRRKAKDDGLMGHVVGVFSVCFAVAYALQHPICG